MIFLEKYELLLASTWRMFKRVHSLLLLISVYLSSPTRGREILQILQMYRYSKSFWSTNNQRNLKNAVTHYYSLRPNWLTKPLEVAKINLEISGWAQADNLRELQNIFADRKIRRVFRPDVWYLTRGRSGLLSGFSFKCRVEEYQTIKAKLDEHSLGFDLDISQDPLRSFEEHETGRFESVRPEKPHRQSNWYAAFSISPREFTWLVETTADKQLASRALDFFRQVSDLAFSREINRCIGIFSLVAGEDPPSGLLREWKQVHITQPNWILAGNSYEITKKNRSPKVEKRYFLETDIKSLNGGLLIKNDHFIDWDPAQRPSLDFVAGNSDLIIGTCANTQKCFVRAPLEGKRYDSGILLGNRVDNNWFHFLIEALPRLFSLDQVVDKSVPILVSDRIPSTGLEALSLVTSREIIQIDATLETTIGVAYVPGPVIYHPDSQFLWDKTSLDDVNFESLSELREKVLAAIHPNESSPKKIYWARTSSHRFIVNSNSVTRCLTKLGFVFQDPTRLTFEEQVQSIMGAQVLVATGGALMSNFLFGKASLRIVLLGSRFIKNYPLPELLATVAGSSVWRSSGRSIAACSSKSVLEKVHSSFYISVRRLRSLLNSLEKADAYKE